MTQTNLQLDDDSDSDDEGNKKNVIETMESNDGIPMDALQYDYGQPKYDPKIITSLNYLESDTEPEKVMDDLNSAHAEHHTTFYSQAPPEKVEDDLNSPHAEHHTTFYDGDD